MFLDHLGSHLFREQLLTKVLQKDYTITDANYDNLVFFYVNPYPTP